MYDKTRESISKISIVADTELETPNGATKLFQKKNRVSARTFFVFFIETLTFYHFCTQSKNTVLISAKLKFIQEPTAEANPSILFLGTRNVYEAVTSGIQLRQAKESLQRAAGECFWT